MIVFGKYKNKPFEFVLQKDKSYCEWCLKQEPPKSSSMKNFQDYLKINLVVDEAKTIEAISVKNEGVPCTGKIKKYFQSCQCHLCENWNGCTTPEDKTIYRCNKCNYSSHVLEKYDTCKSHRFH